MTKITPLKERCNRVLQLKSRGDKRAERQSLTVWTREQKETDLIEWIANLSYSELKIAMNCGLHGKSMTVAMQRLDEYKDHRDQIEREELTGEKPSKQEKPSLDEIQRFMDLPDEVVVRMITNEDNEVLKELIEAMQIKIGKRHPEPMPDVM